MKMFNDILMLTLGVAMFFFWIVILFGDDISTFLRNYTPRRAPKRLEKKPPKISLWRFRRRKQPRTLKAIAKRLERIAKKNPAMREYVGVIADQMLAMTQYGAAFDTIVKESEHGERGEKSRAIFDATVEEMRQNYSDMLNLFIAAGADVGRATKKTLNLTALRTELESNQKKLDYLKQLTEQVTTYVNQVDGAGVNLGIETEIAALTQLNQIRQEASAAAEMMKNGQSPFLTSMTEVTETISEPDFTDAGATFSGAATAKARGNAPEHMRSGANDTNVANVKRKKNKP